MKNKMAGNKALYCFLIQSLPLHVSLVFGHVVQNKKTKKSIENYISKIFLNNMEYIFKIKENKIEE